MNLTLSSWAAIGPILSLLLGTVILVWMGTKEVTQKWILRTTFGSLFVSAIMVPFASGKSFPNHTATFHLSHDLLTSSFFGLFLCIASVISLLSLRYLQERECFQSQYFALILLGTSGMMIVAASRDLLSMMLGLETMSLAACVLLGNLAPQKYSLKASLKYFLTGAMGTAICILGIAYLYGTTGTIGFQKMGLFVATHLEQTFHFQIAGTILLAGMICKLAAVPFQMWMIDVYKRAPSPVTAYIMIGFNVAIFSVLLRLTTSSFGSAQGDWFALLLGGLSAASMIWGHFAAAAQRNIKQMLVYASIGHSGMLLLALTSRSEWSGSVVLFASISFTLIYLGMFTVIMALETLEGKQLDIDSYAGLANRYPVFSLTLTIFILSLAGLPPTLGFMAKWMVMSSILLKGGMLMFVLLSVSFVMSLVAVYYSMRILFFLYMVPPHPLSVNIPTPRPLEQRLATVLCMAVLLLGIWPPLQLLQERKGPISNTARTRARAKRTQPAAQLSTKQVPQKKAHKKK